MNARTARLARAVAVAFIAGCAAVFAQATAANAATDCFTRPGNAALLIKAVVLARDRVLSHGQVLIGADGRIACAGKDCSVHARGATVLTCPRYVLSPGLINTHDHTAFTGDAPRKDTGERFAHRHEWRLGLDGHHPAQGEDPDHDPRVIAWGELRFLAGGTTSIVGGSMSPGLVRNLDFRAGLEGLPVAPVVYKVFPLDDASGIMRTHDCNYGPHPSTRSDVAHARFSRARRRRPRCRSPQRISLRKLDDVRSDARPRRRWNQRRLDHAASDADSRRRVDAGGSRTHRAPSRESGVVAAQQSRAVRQDAGRAHRSSTRNHDRARLGLAALGLDEPQSELVCAAYLDRTRLHGALSTRDLWRMVTIDAARVVHDAERIGSIAPQFYGDVALYTPRGRDPYAAVVESTPQSTALVIRGGRILYGMPAIVDRLRGGCSTIAAGGTTKRLCGEPGRPSGGAMQAFARARDLYPVAFDGTPRNEPPCEEK